MGMNMNQNCSQTLADSMPMPGMEMFFHFSSCERLLFFTWRITNPGELVGAIVAVFFMAVFYEGLKTLRELLLYWDLGRFKGKKAKNGLLTGGQCVAGEYDPVPTLNSDEDQPPNNKVKTYTISLTMHSLQSALHVVQVGYGYLLMLVAMTYNGWLFLAVCFGAGVGYFLFGRTRHILGINDREKHEHCH